MHGDPQRGGGVTTISIGDLELTSIDHEAQEAQAEERTEDHGEVRINEDERRGHSDPASSRDAGTDTGGNGWHQGDLFGAADSDGGERDDGRNVDPQSAAMQQLGEGGEPARDQVDPDRIDVFHVPAPRLARALELGAGLGVEKVILASDDETISEVQADLMSGRKQFWSATQHGEFIGCMITCPKKSATGLVLDLPYMAGRKPETWLPLMANLIGPMAIEAGYEAIETHTREGMRKFMISQGFRKTSIRMRLDLNGQQIKDR
jgi:hypothetical protein